MLIPTFKLDQTDEFVIVIIRLPYVKISKSEFFIEGLTFKYFLHPYLLNLTFKQMLKHVEDPAQSTYNHDTYELTVKLLKENKGEEFEDLQMLTKLINKTDKLSDIKKTKKTATKKPLIEVVNENSGFTEDSQNQLSQEDNLLIDQSEKYNYGFNEEYKNYFVDLEEEILEIGVLNPENVAKTDRKQIRQDVLEEKFDEEHYLFDFFDNEEEIEEKIYTKLSLLQDSTDKNQDEIKKQDAYDSQEWNTLVKLPNKQYILKNKSEVFLQIADICFAYLYELRVFDDDFGCESAPTVNQLSSVLSCFTVDSDIKDVIIENFKRSLTYPLLRNFNLAQKTQQDLGQLFKKGKLSILKVFLKLKSMFDNSEPRHLLNQLYIDDFCVIIQHFENSEFHALGDQILALKIQKSDLQGLDLKQLEKSAQFVMDDMDKQEPSVLQKEIASQINEQPQELTEEFLQKQQQEKEEYKKILNQNKIQQQEEQEQQQNKNQKQSPVLVEEVNTTPNQEEKIQIQEITEKVQQTKLDDLDE